MKPRKYVDRIPEEEIPSDEEAREFCLNNNWLLKNPEDHAMVKAFREIFPGLKGGRFLDIGSGSCNTSAHVAMAYPSAEIVAVDASSFMNQFADSYLKACNVRNRIKLVKAKLPSRIAEPKSFDLVYSRSTLHHFANPINFWMTVKNYAKPNGFIYVMDLARPNGPLKISNLIDNAKPEMRDMYLRSFLASYSLEEVRGHLDATGLEMAEVNSINGTHLYVCRNKVFN